jgi:hypothetical protein
MVLLNVRSVYETQTSFLGAIILDFLFTME